mgnify:CR=1 FL=1
MSQTIRKYPREIEALDDPELVLELGARCAA